MKAVTATSSFHCRSAWSDPSAAEETAGDRRQGALPRAGARNLDRQRPHCGAMDPRNQIRLLPVEVHLANEAVKIFIRRGYD